MKVGLFLPHVGEHITTENILYIATEAEKGGIDSVWTFSRIVNYANGWIGVAGFGPLEQLAQAINGLKESARKADKEPSKVGIYMVSYPNILESAPSSSNQNRMPMTGTIEEIGSDIEHIKAMGTDHIIFGHLFSSLGRDMKKMVEVTMQLARYAK
ncbi:MAG: LLM class flavin-dependent oxidoreductase [Ignavibacteriales bacterium]